MELRRFSGQFPYIIASGFSPAKLGLTGQMFYMLLPSLVLSGVASIWRAIQCGERLLWQRCRGAGWPLSLL